MMNATKYTYHSGKKKKSTLKFILALFLGMAAICAGIYFVFFHKWTQDGLPSQSQNDISSLWTAKNYDDIISLAEKKLGRDPLDQFYLTFRGISYFYKSKSEPEKREVYLNKAVFSLRKAKLVQKDRYGGEVNYILGLSYFLKGKYFYDLAIKFMEESIRYGYKGIDTYRCLGLAYGGLENPEKELEYFLLALKEDETAASLLSVGEAYIKKNQHDKAEEYIVRAVNKTGDENIVSQARARLGEIYMERKDYIKAEEQYRKIIKINPKSANAYFYLGEIYANLGDLVKARSFFRETLKIDPAHYGAKLRFYK